MKRDLKIHIPISEKGYIEAHGQLQELLDLHARISPSQLTTNTNRFVEFNTFTGEKILYDDIDHIYTDLQGEKLISGSKFAAKYAKKFDKESVSAAVAEREGVTQDIVQTIWHDNGDSSRTFGNAGHKALENYFRYRMYTGIYKLPKHKILYDIVTTFPHYGEECECEPEAIVSCIKRKMVGRLDNIIWVDRAKKIVDIWDYKFAGKLSKEDLYKYSIQVNYYAKLLEFMGFTVRNMLLQNMDKKWTEYKIERIDLTKLDKRELIL